MVTVVERLTFVRVEVVLDAACVDNTVAELVAEVLLAVEAVDTTALLLSSFAEPQAVIAKTKHDKISNKDNSLCITIRSFEI